MVNIAHFIKLNSITIMNRHGRFAVTLEGVTSNGRTHELVVGEWNLYKEAQICARGFAALFQFPIKGIIDQAPPKF
ncbi:DUF4085 family protein [Paenibacillus silviterrae]|uniref:DUF4085 family protein n=1 Tax=Paenibacillus silviterrae TaxID=3242194 RepID=UPI00350E38DE